MPRPLLPLLLTALRVLPVLFPCTALCTAADGDQRVPCLPAPGPQPGAHTEGPARVPLRKRYALWRSSAISAPLVCARRPQAWAGPVGGPTMRLPTPDKKNLILCCVCWVLGVPPGLQSCMWWMACPPSSLCRPSTLWRWVGGWVGGWLGGWAGGGWLCVFFAGSGQHPPVKVQFSPSSACPSLPCCPCPYPSPPLHWQSSEAERIGVDQVTKILPTGAASGTNQREWSYGALYSCLAVH